MGIKQCINCGHKYKTSGKRNTESKIVQNCVRCTKRFDDNEAQRIIREVLE